jgi:HAD superfamily hydrolase (TIGR01509 family)
MAVASNGTRANVERTLVTVGLRRLFDELVAIEDVAHGKPAPDLYQEVARRLGVLPADCIVFEDTDEGLQAARGAGMRARDIRLSVAPDPDA